MFKYKSKQEDISYNYIRMKNENRNSSDFGFVYK